MAYTFPIQIDGAPIPPPSSYSFSETDLVANSERNASGYANWDVVRTNVGNLELEWANLDAGRLAQIVSVIRGRKTFDATFFNSITARWETRTFYAGDRAAKLLRYISCQQFVTTLSVPFIEV